MGWVGPYYTSSLIGKLDKNIGEVLKRTPKNCQLNSPQIQKEIVVERMELESKLNLYYANVRKDDSFVDLNGITDLAIMMVKKRKHISYLLVYRLLKLALVLPVATASVERCFSAMKIIKSDLRDRISQGFLNSCVICGVEREALENVKDEDVMKWFQNMADRKGHL